MARAYDLVLLVRFLPRELLPKIGQLLAPGGVVLLQHFDEEAMAWGRPPRRSHVRGRGEGRALLEEAGLKVRVKGEGWVWGGWGIEWVVLSADGATVALSW